MKQKNAKSGSEEGPLVNCRAVVRYDGGGFAGWQVQPDQRTVQGAIEEALSQMASRPVRIHGASRTDAGVHAMGQVFSWEWVAGADLGKLRRSLCTMLGPDIRVESVEPADEHFHARKSARSKRYAYVLDLTRHPDPFMRRFAWQIPWELDFALMERLAAPLVGTHDFAGFQGGGGDKDDTTRTLFDIRLERGAVVGPAHSGSAWRLEFHGDGFLYKMVRNLTGTLVDIGRGRSSHERLEELLAAPGPFHGHSAPPQGLFLLEVHYE